MPLDAFAESNDVSRPGSDNTNALELLKNSFNNKLSQQWDGVRQLFDQHVALTPDQAPAEGLLNRGAQIAGQLAAEVLPVLAIGAASRYGLGRVISEPESRLLTAHPKLGLSLTESGLTGLASGLMLNPKEDADKTTAVEFYRLRALYGLGNAISFAAMTGSSALTSTVGRAIFRSSDNILTNPVINGAIAGIPGGFLNVQFDSANKTGYFTGDLHAIGQSILSTSLTGAAFGGLTGSIGYIHEQNFSDFAQVRKSISSDKEAVGILNDLHGDFRDFRSTAQFIESNPQENPAFVAKMLKSGASSGMLNQYQLSGMRDFDLVAKPDADLFRKSVELADNGLDMASLARFIAGDVEYRKDWVLENIRQGADLHALKPERLGAIEVAYRLLGHEPEKVQNLVDLFRHDDYHADYVATSVYSVYNKMPEFREQLKGVLREAADERSRHKLFEDELRARLSLADRFGQDSEATARLSDLQNHGLTLSAIEYASSLTTGGADLTKQLIESGAPPEHLRGDRLEGLVQLNNAFQNAPHVVSKILDFEGPGTNLQQLASFMNQAPGNKEILENFVKTATSPNHISIKRMEDATQINFLSQSLALPPESLTHLQELQHNGLSAARMVDYLSENKDTRIPMIQYMLQRNDGVKRFNDQMKLTLFPDAVAYHLIEDANASGVPIPSIVSRLKEWRSGRKFSELLQQQVSEIKPITREIIDQLTEKAGGLGAKPANDGGSWSADRRPPHAGANSERRGFFAPKADYQNSESLAGALTKVADKIISRVPEGNTIVLLGRDAWPLVPLLRDQGRDVQYFLWSRMQYTDKKTHAQWLKEVPPNSYVVDTGYGGTILKTIKNVDKSSTGWLIKANAPFKYRQLLWGTESIRAVTALEGLPKSVGRASTYTESGSAVSRNANRDEDEAKVGEGLRWVVEGKNRSLLRAMNLPDWDVWRFSSYVGLHPKERLFLGSDDAVQKHYDKVQTLRDHRPALSKLLGRS